MLINRVIIYFFHISGTFVSNRKITPHGSLQWGGNNNDDKV